jgi:hypothetical protein
MTTTILILLIVGAGILFVCLVTGFVVLVLFRQAGGWQRLIKGFATTSTPAGQIVERQTVKIGEVTYKRCVTVGIADEGLYLTICRKTVWIPWDEFKGIDQTKLYWENVPVLTVGKPAVTTISVEKDLFERMRGRVRIRT